MDFTADLMWDGATRDHDEEALELARTAALADAEQLVGPLVFQATSLNDLGHRLALVESHLDAISERRGYPARDLTEDLARRWRLLDSARAVQAKQVTAVRQVTAAQEAAMDQAVVHLASLAARENPLVPMVECLRLATEAVKVHADAYPLAYESWGGTSDGPITDRAKHWKPPGMKGGTGGSPAAVDPGANGGAGTFDDVHQRLDALDNRLNAPSGPVSPTASLDAMAAGFMNRVRDWWRSDSAPQHGVTPPSAAPAATHAPADSGPAILSGPGHFEQSYTKGLMDDFDRHKSDLDSRWDANSAAPGASKPYLDEHDPTHDPSNYTKGLMDTFDQAKSEIGTGHAHHPAPASAPEFSHAEPAHSSGPAATGAPGGFSHAETGGAGTGQQHLPTDPNPTFSDSATHTPAQRQDWAHGSHFQYGT